MLKPNNDEIWDIFDCPFTKPTFIQYIRTVPRYNTVFRTVVHTLLGVREYTLSHIAQLFWCRDLFKMSKNKNNHLITTF